MNEEKKMNSIHELDDNALAQVSGGISDDIDLTEERLPLGWHVTCCRCAIQFPVGNGSCPKCGGTRVFMAYAEDVGYDPNRGEAFLK